MTEKRRITKIGVAKRNIRKGEAFVIVDILNGEIESDAIKFIPTRIHKLIDFMRKRYKSVTGEKKGCEVFKLKKGSNGTGKT